MLLKIKSFWLCFVLTVAAFTLLVNLGAWQLSRGEEKRQLELQLETNRTNESVSFTQFLQSHPDSNQPIYTGTKAYVEATPVSGMRFLLDNQTFRGKVGYLAYQLFVDSLEQHFLFELGFVPATNSRQTLPKVDWLDKPVSVNGRVYQRSLNPLSSDIGMEEGAVIRLQNPNIAQLSERLGINISPFMFQPQVDPWPYPQPWKPLPMKSSKHFGYAFQWFAMSFALFMLTSGLIYRFWKTHYYLGKPDKEL